MIEVIRQSRGGMRACVRLEGGECLDWFAVEQSLRQRKCARAPLLSNMLFATVLGVVLQRLSEGQEMIANLVDLHKLAAQGVTEGQGESEDPHAKVKRAVWGMTYA